MQVPAEAKEGSRSSTPKAGAGRSPALAIHASATALTDADPTPDGTRVASTARDGVLRVHDLNTGALLAGFKVGPALAVTCRELTGCMAQVLR